MNNTISSVKNDGDLGVQPMLVEGNMNIGSFGEDPQYSSGLSRQTSTKM